ncbi:MAG: GNAT family N-acetyltransferase [Prosthecobacter sp.]|nr:GNAT family N-acetyltransferase [Prosthecobacter sp.]
MAFLLPPHPLLPEVSQPCEAAELLAHGARRDAAFYQTCHRRAQSLWQQGLPAQAILALNRALSCALPAEEPVLQRLPLPYLPLAWILAHRPAPEFFLGNPRRHWQHLATRMVPPHAELRTWRAWACWYLAKTALPEQEFPPDLQQIRQEGICEPRRQDIAHHLSALSPADDLMRWHAALDWLRAELGLKAKSSTQHHIRRIGPQELPVVEKLARQIWPAVYPGIISQAQIDYMLTVWYQPSAMAREMELRGTWFALIEAAGHGPVGYLSLEPQQPGICFINKLYLLPDWHGCGLGAIALEWCRQAARQMGLTRLQLRVNKANAPAIRAYRRAGFTFVEDICTDIGSGFVMDDYRLECPVG